MKDMSQEKQRLETLAGKLLDQARALGATDAEVGVSANEGFSTTVRLGEVETIEFNRDQGFGITVYFGQRKGSASTSDTSEAAIARTVEAACHIARYTAEDPFAGLPEAGDMATDIPDLDLYHPAGLSPEQAIDMARACEQAGLSRSELLENSEGASVSTHEGFRLYANSRGFCAGYPSSRYSASCVLIARQGEDMQRDYWYDASRDLQDLTAMEVIGEKTAERTLARLGARPVKTESVPVLFAADVAGSLLGHFISAISGGNLYRRSSFLLDRLGEKLFPDFVRIHEQPRLKKGMGSAPFDSDGLATYDKDFVQQGVLSSWALDTYAARRLKLKATANGGGVRNVFIESTGQTLDELLSQMGRGLLVTELMGQGANLVTGDYSRAAAGFWVENGQIQYPVQEATIASTLPEMFMNLQAIGNDVDHRGNYHCGSLLIGEMKVSG